MTNAQKLALRASEIRTRLSELAGVEEITEEQRSEIVELRVEYGEVETRAQAAIIADDEPKPTETSTEARELAELIEGSSIGAIFASTLEHRQTDGPTAELQTELGLSANQIPLALLRDRDAEHRATGVTPAPTNVGATQGAIIPAVFPDSVAAFIGVDTPTVSVGESVFPVLSTSADVGAPAENASQDETAGAFSADVLSPSRLQASFFYSREDRARFMGMDSAVPSIYSIVPPNDGSALRHGHHFEPVDFVIDHGRGHRDAYSTGSCQRTYARACECQ